MTATYGWSTTNLTLGPHDALATLDPEPSPSATTACCPGGRLHASDELLRFLFGPLLRNLLH